MLCPVGIVLPLRTKVIFLTKEDGTPNAFGLGYLVWFFNLKGPTFVITRRREDL